MKRHATFGLVALLAVVSCAGDGVIDSDTVPPGGDAPTLTMLQASIFTPRCAIPACHAPPFPQQGMELTDGNTYAFTVDVPSVELPAHLRVEPGNAAESYLYMKITGDPRIAGERMPRDGTVLAPADIAAIRAWIDTGAKDD